MKKKILIAVLVLALALSTVFAFTLGAGAEEADPALSIGGKKLVLGNSIYLTYMVNAENVADINDVSVLVWNEPQEAYVKGTEKYVVKTNGKTAENKGVTYYEFVFEDVAAKRLADDFYAVAYTKVGDNEYYSAPQKYSVLKYVYNMRDKASNDPTSVKEGLIPMLDAMLDYGATAQYYFDNYKTDRLANADYYQIKVEGGKLSDGFADGFYLEADEVVITANAPADGYKFAGWKKESTGEIVSSEMTATVVVGTANETYTAVYEEDAPDLTALVGKWKGSENMYTIKNDYEFVIEANKIASAKYGDFVMNVTTVKFDGATLTINYTIEGVEDVKTIEFVYADNKLTCDAAVAGGTLELAKTVTVYVDYNGASTKDKTAEIAYGASYKLSKGSYTGHNFIGWTINGVFVATTASSYTIESVTEDTTVVAEWEKKPYVVKFYDQDYNVIKTINVFYGDVLAAEEIPTTGIVTKEGYTFSGNWATSKTSTTAQDLTKPITNTKNYYPIMIEPQVSVGTLAGTWTGTETEDNSYPSYGITDIRTREYTFVIDADGNITAVCKETIDNGEDGITGPIEYTDCVVSDVTFNGTTLKLTVTYKEGSAKKTYTFTYDAEAETLTKSASFVLTKAE